MVRATRMRVEPHAYFSLSESKSVRHWKPTSVCAASTGGAWPPREPAACGRDLTEAEIDLTGS